MAVEVASMYAKLGLDAKDYEQGLRKAGSSFQKFGASLKSGLGTAVKFGVLGMGALGAAGVGVGAKLVSLGSDAEEMSSKFQVVFGEATPRAIAQLDEFGNQVGRSKFELMEMASTVQDTFVPMGFARGEAAGLSVELTKLAVDVASFNNQLDTDVMMDFQSAIVGNHETVRKYGIVITEATLGQELMRMGIAEGTKEASEAEKVQARLNLIYAGTADAQGDAARTAGGWANQMRALKAGLSEAATAAGVELLPVVTPLLQNIVTLAQEALPIAVEHFTTFAANLSETAGPAMLMINDALTRIGAALGLTSEDVTGLDVVLAAFQGTLDAVVIGVQAFAIGMQGIALAVETVVEWIGKAQDALRKFREDLDKLGLGAGGVGAGETGAAGLAVPGFGFVPQANYQSGGIVPGPIGQPQVAVVHGGETIIPASDGGTQLIQLVVDGQVLAEVVSGHQGRNAHQLNRVGGAARL